MKLMLVRVATSVARLNRICLSLLLAIWMLMIGPASVVQAQPRSVSPTSLGFSTERLQRLDAAMQAQIDDGRVAGVSLMIVRHGKVIHNRRYGYQDLASRTPLRSDAIFRMQSMTKPLIAAGLMVLYEEGRWQFDDPVAKFLPELADLRVGTAQGTQPLDHPITMRELLTSTAGFPSPNLAWAQNPAVDRAYLDANLRSSTLSEMIAKLPRLPLAAQPGTAFMYGMQHDIQGALIERISGQPLDQFLKERVFEPLGMVDTGFEVPMAQRSRIAPLYAYDEHQHLVLAKRQANFTAVAGERPIFLSGGIGLYSTMADYMRFASMLANGGMSEGKPFLAPSTVALFTSNLLPEGLKPSFVESIAGAGYGVGTAVILDPARVPLNMSGLSKGTVFMAGAYGTWFWIDHANDMIVMGMSQLQSAGNRYAGIATFAPDLRALSQSLTYQALVDPKR